MMALAGYRYDEIAFLYDLVGLVFRCLSEREEHKGQNLRTNSIFML